jgi:hypothetical protein
MILRRWSLVLILLPPGVACASRRAEPVRLRPVSAEALTDAATIRERCEDPEGVLAGRTLCVLKDIPHGPTTP